MTTAGVVASMTSQYMVAAVVVFIFCITGAFAGQTCPMYTTSAGFLYFSGYETCSNGCCGSYPDFYCCSIGTAAVAGIVLGCIVALCVFVFLCSYCLKKKSHSGRVIRPVQPANNTIVYTGMSGSYPMGYAGPPPQHMPAPPPYKRHDDAPPAYATHNQYGHYAGAGTMAAANPYSSQPQQQYPAPGAQYPAPPQYNYGQGQGWSAAGPSTAGGPPATATAPAYTAGPPPTAATSVPPTATSSDRSSTMSRGQRHNYGQGQGWSTAASNDPPATAASTARPPSTAASVPPSTAASGGQASLWESGSTNRNTLTTRNLPPSRLPPLPQLPNDY